MDGQRRIARPLRRPTNPLVAELDAWSARKRYRILARTAAVLFLGLTVVHGAIRGGHLEYEGSPWPKIPGRVSSLFGLAAVDISIAGLDHHAPELVLDAIGIHPGDSLVGFDAGAARLKLQALDWIASASVQRSMQNRLEISVAERQPFAIWQYKGNYAVIDKAGVVMSGLDPRGHSTLPLVTGEGANLLIARYVNQMEAMPELLSKVHAAALVGQRRWTLYLDNGVKIALPENNVAGALLQVAQLDGTQNLLSKGIREIDLRVPGRLVIAVAEAADAEATEAGNVTLSQVR